MKKWLANLIMVMASFVLGMVFDSNVLFKYSLSVKDVELRKTGEDGTIDTSWRCSTIPGYFTKLTPEYSICAISDGECTYPTSLYCTRDTLP